MGMFDMVKCDYPLPGGTKTIGFQTKAFGKWLDRFWITEDGRFMVKTYQVRYTGRWFIYAYDKAGDYGRQKQVEKNYRSKDGELAWQESERINDRWIEVRMKDGSLFTGEFNFYTATRSWHEYVVRFENGQLVDIKKVGKRQFTGFYGKYKNELMLPHRKRNREHKWHGFPYDLMRKIDHDELLKRIRKSAAKKGKK